MYLDVVQYGFSFWLFYISYYLLWGTEVIFPIHLVNLFTKFVIPTIYYVVIKNFRVLLMSPVLYLRCLMPKCNSYFFLSDDLPNEKIDALEKHTQNTDALSAIGNHSVCAIAKTVHALDRSATVTGSYFHKFINISPPCLIVNINYS
jgi:hypothetical protein